MLFAGEDARACRDAFGGDHMKVGVSDDIAVQSWALSIIPFGGGPAHPIASGTSAVNNAVLGQLDPTLLANGSYTLDASNAAYQHLAQGATTNVVANYTVTDQFGAHSTNTLTITVTGTNDAPIP